MNKKLFAEKRIAYHEAGHAVTAYLLRTGLRHVSIVPEDDALGHVLSRKIGKVAAKEIEYGSANESRKRAIVRKMVIVCFAGGISEEIAFGECKTDGCSHDFEQAVDFATYVTETEEETEKLVDEMWLETKKLLQVPCHWQAIEAIADQLLQDSLLGQKQARRIISAAIQASDDG